MKFKTLQFGFASLLAAGLLACGDSSSNVAGGVTDIGNTVATGHVYNVQGNTVARVRVVAYKDSYESESIIDSIETVSNDSGAFFLDMDSSSTYILYAEQDSACGLAKASTESNDIVIGKRQHLAGNMLNTSSGFVRVVGTPLKAEIHEDGSFVFDAMPPGYITMAYFAERGHGPEGRMEFYTDHSMDSLAMPDIEHDMDNDGWLMLRDEDLYDDRFHEGMEFMPPPNRGDRPPKDQGGEPEQGNPSREPQQSEEFLSVKLPPTEKDLYGFSVPVKISTRGLAESDFCIFKGQRQLAFEIESWDEYEGLLWVTMDTLKAGFKDVALSIGKNCRENIKNEGSSLHMNGTETVYDNDSTIAKSATYVGGIFGKGITLEKGQFIDMGNIDPSKGDFTISLWVKWNGPNGNHQVLVAKRSYWSDSTSRFQWHFASEENSFMILKSNPNEPEGFAFGDSSIVPIGEWAHLALVFKNNMASMYVNGEQVQEPREFKPNELKKDVPLRIGGDEISDETWNGIIDEIRIENVARDADWLKAIYFTHPQHTF